MAMIEVRDVVKRYGASVAVGGVSFDVDRGEILGFLGPNGAGKSTTMKIITNFIAPDEGAVRVAGHDIFAEPLQARRRIGYLPENTPLYLEMGVVEFLEYVCDLRGLRGRRRRQRLGEMIDVCGLAPEITKVIGELSKGYRQRVGLAQAMIHDPDVLILDEPTSGLDPNQIADIRALIREIGREKTILLSTHILPEVTTTCTRALIISRGRIAGSGTPDELQRRASGGSLFVTARGPKEAMRAALCEIQDVSDVVVASEPGAGRVRFALKVAAGADPGESVFQLMAARGWPLSELRYEAASLEDVFRQLTTGEA